MTSDDLENRIAALEAAIGHIAERDRLQEELLDALAKIVALLAAEKPGKLTELSAELLDQLGDIERSRSQR